MTYMTLFNLLAGLAVFFGVYFAYSTTKEESKEFDFKEFFKILGLFLVCGVVFGIFVELFLVIVRLLLWLLTVLFDFLSAQILTTKVGGIVSLLAINAMGGYLFWEMWKEKKEREESGLELSTAGPAPETAPELSATSQESKTDTVSSGTSQQSKAEKKEEEKKGSESDKKLPQKEITKK